MNRRLCVAVLFILLLSDTFNKNEKMYNVLNSFVDNQTI